MKEKKGTGEGGLEGKKVGSHPPFSPRFWLLYMQREGRKEKGEEVGFYAKKKYLLDSRTQETKRNCPRRIEGAKVIEAQNTAF